LQRPDKSLDLCSQALVPFGARVPDPLQGQNGDATRLKVINQFAHLGRQQAATPHVKVNDTVNLQLITCSGQARNAEGVGSLEWTRDDLAGIIVS